MIQRVQRLIQRVQRVILKESICGISMAMAKETARADRLNCKACSSTKKRFGLYKACYGKLQ